MEEIESFGLTEEEQMLQDMVGVWQKKKLPPALKKETKRENTLATCSNS